MPAATELSCRVDVPKGGLAPASSIHASEPVGRRNPRCPADWCYFPDTLARHGGPLGAVVCVSEPGKRGHRIAVKPIALLRTHDTCGYDEIVVCVPLVDQAWTTVESIYEVPRELREEIERFAIDRKPARVAAAVAGWQSRDDALMAIDDAAARWAATVNGRG